MDYGALSLLVVDDDAVTRAAIVRLLRRIGFGTITEAADGSEALARCDRNRFDAIITDVEMVPVDGLTFLKEFRGRSDSAGRETPVIIITMLTEPDIVVEAHRSGANALLLKPITAPLLLQKLDRVLAARSPVREGVSL